MTAPTVKHGRDRVMVHLPAEILDDALTALARILADDSDSGPVATALRTLADADLLLSASQETCQDWMVGNAELHDAFVHRAEALEVLRDAVGGGLVLGLRPLDAHMLSGDLVVEAAQTGRPGRVA